MIGLLATFASKKTKAHRNTGPDTKSNISIGWDQVRRLSPNVKAMIGIATAKMSSAQPSISTRGIAESPLLSIIDCAY